MNRLMHPRQGLKHCTNKLLILLSLSQKTNTTPFQRVQHNPVISELREISFLVMFPAEKKISEMWFSDDGSVRLCD